MAEYIPGVCNLGAGETRRRWAFGWVGLILTISTWALFIKSARPPLWRLTLFVPAFLSALGFVQALSHFCVAFGFAGLFNVGPEAGRTESVEQQDYRRKDQRTALKIVAISATIAGAVALAAYLIPL
jgi:hypothetical protein